MAKQVFFSMAGLVQKNRDDRIKEEIEISAEILKKEKFKFQIG
jgi:hypothetical protein